MAAWDLIWGEFPHLLHQKGFAVVTGIASCYIAGDVAGDTWCRWDIGLLYDLPPGPRFEGPSIDLNNPV